MVLELHGFPHSTCTLRVLTVAQELGIELPIVTVDLMKDLKNQPFGQVPYLVDDEFVLFESRAISKHLARKFGNGKLLPDPSNVQAVALFDQGASVEVADFEPSAFGVCYEKVFTSYRGQTADEAQLEKHIHTLKGKLEGYERILSKQKYLGGDELTVVDLFHLPHGTISEPFMPGVFEEHPHVAKWWQELKSRESWIKTSGKNA